MESDKPAHFPVVIAGGGPVGMVLAMSLAAMGVRAAVVNTETDTRWHPKGSTQNARTMEHYRRLGVAGAVRKVGLPPDHPTDVGYFTRLNGYEVSRLTMPSEAEKRRKVGAGGATDQVPEPLLRCNQMYAERELYAHLKTIPGTERRYGWRCIGFEEERDRVVVRVAEVASGKTETWTCAYLVGADGAQGLVRRTLGIHYGGVVLEEQVYGAGATVSTHLRAPALYDRILPRLARPCWMHWIVNPKARGLLTTLDGKGEFLFNTRCRSVDEPPDRDLITRQFQIAVGEAVPVEFIGYWPWTAGQALVADRFGSGGRVLLAGDAVHLFTPTGGFGMNTGIDDAANLAWKLAAMAQGWGGPKLVPSYEAERRPIAFRNTGHAKRLSRNIADVPVGEEIDEPTQAGAAERRAAALSLATFGEEFASIGVQLGARYDDSPIVAPDGTDPPPDDPAIYVPSACPGGRAPHLFLKDGSSLYDRFGRGFTLLRLAHSRDDGGALAMAAARRRVPLEIVDVPMAEARALYECGLALVRPDQHVAWRGDRCPADSDALLARVTGW